MFEGELLTSPDGVGVADEVAAAPPREPPVCGEWSYDDSELEETRFSARRIDGVAAPTSKATPIHPIKVISEKRGGDRLAAAQPRLAEIVRPSAAGPAPTRALRPTVEALRRAHEQSPGDTVRALAFASALERSGDPGAALRTLDAAEGGGADAFAIACARASALGAQLKYDDATKMLKRAAKLRPEDPELLVQSGILACRRGRWKDAIEPLQKGVTLSPEHATAHYFIGEALNHTDRLEDALAAYERAADIDPENWRALKGIGIMLDRLGRSPEAAAFYRAARDAQRA